MRQSNFNLAKQSIISFFNSQDKQAYSFSDISHILSQNRNFWKLSKNTTTPELIRQLVRAELLTPLILQFSPSKKFKRYTLSNCTIFSLAMSLDSNAYFSHYTAMFIHNLTVQLPKIVYINIEQPSKGEGGSALTQDSITRAFSRPQRQSNAFFNFNEMRLCLLNGKNTGNLGVITNKLYENTTVSVTSIERTLIDIAVRPSYAGGVGQVISAYKTAQPIVSINKLTQLLTKLNYVYPYHQAIGFYLERSGVYSVEQISIIENQFKREFDFYASYNIFFRYL